MPYEIVELDDIVRIVFRAAPKSFYVSLGANNADFDALEHEARAKMPPALANKTLTSGEAAVARLRKLLGE